MATTAAAAGGVDGAPANLRLSPETYTTIGTLLDQNKDFVIPQLVETYGYHWYVEAHWRCKRWRYF